VATLSGSFLLFDLLVGDDFEPNLLSSFFLSVCFFLVSLLFSYFCVKSAMMTNAAYPCPRCGSQVKNIERVSLAKEIEEEK